jgi:hypothetical protein
MAANYEQLYCQLIDSRQLHIRRDGGRLPHRDPGLPAARPGTRLQNLETA